MNCKIIYGGFNPRWQAGRLEREIVDNLVIDLERLYPNLKKLLVVTSWHDPNKLIEEIKLTNPQLTVLCSLTDPLGPIENLLENIPGKVILVGYVDGNFYFDFWAVACLNFFKKYNNLELEPTHFKYVYLNYNRKPHRHRINFIQCLETYNLIDAGCVTLGKSKYTLNEYPDDYKQYGADDVVGDVGIPNDIYSLGQIDVWNKSFINVVSETQFEFSKNVFLSEKIFKPILGLRPFIINGSPGIYGILKRSGFDCFDDLFPVTKLQESQFDHYKFAIHSTICDCLVYYRQQDLMTIYNQIKPRLLYNQNLFYEYARNQRINIQLNF